MLVGTAELDVRAVGSHFTSDLNTVVKPGMAKAGAVMEQTATRGRQAFSHAFSLLGPEITGAFGPVTQMMDQLHELPSILRESKHSLTGLSMGAGAGLAAGGLFAQQFGAGEKGAQQQLQAAIEATGHTWADYSKRIEEAVKVGEAHGRTTEQTYQALNTMTVSTHDATKSLDNLQLVMQIAATRHMDLNSAALMVARSFGGNVRWMKQFGQDVTSETKLVAAATAAHKAHATAVDKLKTARQNLADTEARVGAARKGHAASASQLASAEASLATAQAAVSTANFEHGSASPQYAAALARVSAAEAHLNDVRTAGTTDAQLSVSQQIELRKAHEAVSTAQQQVTKTANDQAAAHKAAAGAATSLQSQLNNVSTSLAGQDAAVMHTFTGEVDHFRATVEDAASSWSNKFGPAVTDVGGILFGLGAIGKAGTTLFGKLKGGSAAAAAESSAAWTAADGEIAAAGRTAAAKVEAADATMAASAEASATASAAAWRGALAGIATKYGPLLAALGLYEYGKHVLGPANATVHTDKYGQVRRNDTNELVPGSKFSAPGGMVLTPNHKAAIDAQTPPPPPHPTAPGQRRIDMPGQPMIRIMDGEGSAVVSELRAGRLENQQQLHALRQLLVAVQDLNPPGAGRRSHRKFSSPSLTTIDGPWASPEILSGR